VDVVVATDVVVTTGTVVVVPGVTVVVVVSGGTVVVLVVDVVVVVVSGATVVVVIVALVSVGKQLSFVCVEGALNDRTLMIGNPTAIKRPELCRDARSETMPTPSNMAIMATNCVVPLPADGSTCMHLSMFIFLSE
jgi:hypothetical protein